MGEKASLGDALKEKENHYAQQGKGWIKGEMTASKKRFTRPITVSRGT